MWDKYNNLSVHKLYGGFNKFGDNVEAWMNIYISLPQLRKNTFPFPDPDTS